MNDYQEGYNDGLAGAGMQDRMGRGSASYRDGFDDGSLDRKVMLKEEQEK